MRWSPLALPDARDEFIAVTSRQAKTARAEGHHWVAASIEQAKARNELDDDAVAEVYRQMTSRGMAESIAEDVERLADTARRAELTWVTRDMTRLALDASRDLPEWSPAAVVPFPYGLLVWDGALPEIPLRVSRSDNDQSLEGHSYRMVPLSGITWGPADTTVMRERAVAWDEETATRTEHSIDLLGFGAITVTLLGRSEDVRHARTLDEDDVSNIKFRYGESVLMEIGTFNLPGRMTSSADVFDPEMQQTHDSRIGSTVEAWRKTGHLDDMISVVQAIGATWSLMMQPQISRHAREWHDPDPNRRGKPPRKTGDVTIIDLRPIKAAALPKEAEALTGKKAYSCRWVVRGHWRQTPCGPNRSLRKPVWIASYIAGPENMPLRLTEHVHVWRR